MKTYEQCFFSAFCPHLPPDLLSFLIHILNFFLYISLVWYLNYSMVAFIFRDYVLGILVWHEKIKVCWFFNRLMKNLYAYVSYLWNLPPLPPNMILLASFNAWRQWKKNHFIDNYKGKILPYFNFECFSLIYTPQEI